MSKIGRIEKKVGSRFLSYYELEAIRRDGGCFPYYMVSRNPDTETLKAVTHHNEPDGVILFGVYGDQKDQVVLIRQYRFPIGAYVYELPAGLIEPGEDLITSGVREMYEETGLHFDVVGASKPFYMSVGMTDESCGTVFGYCSGDPTTIHQEDSEEIQVVIADRAECRRILKEENVALPCAYMLMHFIASECDPLACFKSED